VTVFIGKISQNKTKRGKGVSGVTLAVTCIVAALAACGISSVLVRNGHRNVRALDETWSGPQKIHEVPVPRVGGVAIAIGSSPAWRRDLRGGCSKT
jgi:hypothetical protein